MIIHEDFRMLYWIAALYTLAQIQSYAACKFKKFDKSKIELGAAGIFRVGRGLKFIAKDFVGLDAGESMYFGTNCDNG